MPPSNSASCDFPQQKSKNPIVWCGELQLPDMTVSVHARYLLGKYNRLVGHLPSGMVYYTNAIMTMPELTIHDLRNPDTCICICIEGDQEGFASESEKFFFREMTKSIMDSGSYGFELSKNNSVYLKNDDLSRLLVQVCPEAYQKYGGMNYMLMVMNK